MNFFQTPSAQGGVRITFSSNLVWPLEYQFCWSCVFICLSEAELWCSAIPCENGMARGMCGGTVSSGLESKTVSFC